MLPSFCFMDKNNQVNGKEGAKYPILKERLGEKRKFIPDTKKLVEGKLEQHKEKLALSKMKKNKKYLDEEKQ